MSTTAQMNLAKQLKDENVNQLAALRAGGGLCFT